MRLRTYESAEGDCLLLTSGDGRHALFDGGRSFSFRRSTLPDLQSIAEDEDELELVCVSHIDRDHIEGVLTLVDIEFKWRVRDFQHGHDNPDFPDPEDARTPRIRNVWHNAFDEQIGDAAEPIADLLAASAAKLAAVPERTPELESRIAREEGLAFGVRQGIRLSHRLRPQQLGIALNADFGGLLATRDSHQGTNLGSAALTVIAPTVAELEKLRDVWDAWLQDNESAVTSLQADAVADAEELVLASVEERQLALRLRANRFADRSKVTAQNRASITVLAEENDASILLTGDAHQEEILNGLEEVGRHRSGNGGFHLDVLKVQHHGSEHNLDTHFANRVTANDYVFCGNGSHRNPDRSVVKAIIDSRVSGTAVTAERDNEFKLWFNATPGPHLSEDRDDHMRSLRDYVRNRAADHADQLSFEFLDTGTPFFDLEV